MCEKTTKLIVDDIFDDLREETNRNLNEIIENINHFSLVLNTNNKIDLNLVQISLTQLQENYEKYKQNENYLQISIQDLIRTFKHQLNEKSEIELKSRQRVESPKRKSISETKTKTNNKTENIGETDPLLKSILIKELLKKCNKSQESDKTFSENLSETNGRESDQKLVKRLDFECNDCKKHFRSKAKLESHIYRHHIFRVPNGKAADRTYRCDINGCNKAFKTKTALFAHKVKHGIARPYRCGLNGCNKTYKSESSLCSHQKLVNHSVEQFSCDFLSCNMTFRSALNLKKHKYLHTYDKSFSFYNKTKTFKQNSVNIMSKKSTNIPELAANETKVNANINSMPIGCNECEIKFETQLDLELHTNQVHKQRNIILECNECSEIFNNKVLLLRHLAQKHNKPTVFRCESCPYETIRNSNLIVHKRRHTSDKPNDRQFNGCDKRIKFGNELTQNQLDQKSTGEYRCDWAVCKRSFRNQLRLRLHKTTHFADNSYNYYKKSRKQVECKKCSKLLASRYSLKRHERRFHRGCHHKCTICGQTFEIASSLRKHLKTHEEVHRFQCQECERVLTSELDLKIHVNRDHRLSQPFECDKCDKKFFANEKLLNHLAKQHYLAVFACDSCEHKTYTKHSLNLHKARHTMDRPFECGIDGCDKRFKLEYYRKQHQNNCHLAKKFRCDWDQCLRQFSTKTLFDIHRQKHLLGKRVNTVSNKKNVAQKSLISGQKLVDLSENLPKLPISVPPALLVINSSNNTNTNNNNNLIIRFVDENHFNTTNSSLGSHESVNQLTNRALEANTNTYSTEQSNKLLVNNKTTDNQIDLIPSESIRENSHKCVDSINNDSETDVNSEQDLIKTEFKWEIKTEIKCESIDENPDKTIENVSNSPKIDETIGSNMNFVENVQKVVKTEAIDSKMDLKFMVKLENNRNLDSSSEQTLSQSPIDCNQILDSEEKSSNSECDAKDKQFLCNKCAKSFDLMPLYLNHMKTHFNAKEIALKCTECAFITKDLMSLIGHQKTHKKPIE